jgi:hypothetical protein
MVSRTIGEEVPPLSAAIVHVGGRGGYIPFTFPKSFDSAIHLVLIDAADDGITSKVSLSDGRTFKGRIDPLRAVIFSDNSPAIFRRTSCPFASGLKPFNELFNEWYSFGNGDCDYVLGEAHDLLESEPVDCVTLDSLFQKGSLPSKPTILSIDAQGLSLEIISGSRDFLTQNVHVIICEAELISFYGGTPSFSHILQLLADWGFLFFGFLPSTTTWASPVRRPVGQRGLTHRGSEDAIFIRDVRQIRDFCIESQAAYSFFCHVFGSVEAGTYIAERLTERQSNDVIQEFVQEVRGVLPHQQRYPLTFKQKQKRAGVSQQALDSIITRALLDLRLMASADYPTLGWSRYERILRRWGFQKLAYDVRVIRKQQTLHSH